MSELIQMRQRIKAIETIKKVTHAMRLIAMSLHARMRAKRLTIDEYAQEITNLFARIAAAEPQWTHPVLWPTTEAERELSIIIGSQKGLAGTFNTHLAAFFAHQTMLKDLSEMDLITIGKRMVDIMSNFAGHKIMELKTFNQSNLTAIAKKITDYILHKEVAYRSIIIYYNFPKTFFAQKPQALTISPFETNITSVDSLDPYEWQQEPATILDKITYNLIFSKINQALIQSLIAEQSARFIAMDSSTRNASNLLDEMRLNYNKLRQTKITRELTDLVSGL
jgi:F-type H+-transporting ATPase subunit gamma